MDELSFVQWVELAANIATAPSLCLGVLIYWRSTLRERLDREYGTYDALDDKYIDFLKLCVEHPRLNIYSKPLDDERALSGEDRVRQQAAFEILISILERSFLMYHDQSTGIKKRQWSGWSDYLDGWVRDERFAAAWRSAGEQYDTEFCGHVADRMKRFAHSSRAPATASAKA